MDEILEARRRIAPYVRRTPLLPSEHLSTRAGGAPVWLKLESLQVTSSFKARGAFNAAVSVRERDRSGALPRLVAVSTGNHGRALSYAARVLGFDCVVFAPSTTPRAKLDAIRANGADLITSAADYDQAERDALALAASAGDAAVFVSPYNDARIIAATGTIALELFDDQPALDTILVPIGGGGLISGIAIAAKAIRPDTRVIGVEAAANPAFHTARARGAETPIDPRPTLAEALSGNFEPGSLTIDPIMRLVDDIILVDEAEIAGALRDLALHDRIVVEGAGAVAAAAVSSGRVALRGGRTAVIVSGANIDSERLVSILGQLIPGQLTASEAGTTWPRRP
jgi:threonine dehydratase